VHADADGEAAGFVGEACGAHAVTAPAARIQNINASIVVPYQP